MPKDGYVFKSLSINGAAAALDGGRVELKNVSEDIAVVCVFEKAGGMVEESIFIGDSIAHDVTGAQNIGMPVILYRPKENVNEIECLQTEKGKCPVIAHFSQFFEAEKML